MIPAVCSVDACCLCFGNALKLAFLTKISFKFGKDAKHIEQSLASGSSGVDGLFDVGIDGIENYVDELLFPATGLIQVFDWCVRLQMLTFDC